LSVLPITVIVPTKNEERAIAACLDSLVPYFEAVIVVDSNSQDATQAIAVRSGARVVNFAWNGLYPKKKQWCLDNLDIKSRWVLFVDADESPSAELLTELDELSATNYGGKQAFDAVFDYYWCGRLLRHGQKVRKRILLDRMACRFPALDDLDAPGMGEQEGHYQPTVEGVVGLLRSPMQHEDPDPLSDWFARHNRYSDWEAFLRLHPATRKGVRAARSRQGQVLERLPLKPLAVFLYNYVAKLGWRDGRAGFDFALALAFYQWQISVKVHESLAKRKTPARSGSLPAPTVDAPPRRGVGP
jgi:glycosyltransferase involved in cell wall biosynthesis